MLKGALVGLGRMGITHYCILNTHPEVQLVAASDPSSFVLGNFATFTGVRPYADYREMLERERPDFVLVASPTGSHAEIVSYALQRDIHTFVEKPFALSTQQGEAILQLLDSHPVVNQVGYVVRFNDVFLRVKELLDRGALGRLISFKAEMYGPTVLHDVKTGWRAKKAEGGGCLFDFASHLVDLTTYMFGAPSDVVGTVFQTIHSTAVEDALSSTFVYDSGLRGSVLACWSDPSHRKPSYRFEVMGRRGTIIADLHAYKAFFTEPPDIGGHTSGWNIRYVTDFAQPVRMYLRGYEFTRQLDAFIDRIVDRSKPCLCSFRDGHATDSLIARMSSHALRIGV